MLFFCEDRQMDNDSPDSESESEPLQISAFSGPSLRSFIQAFLAIGASGRHKGRFAKTIG
jgi:hypothetical protein